MKKCTTRILLVGSSLECPDLEYATGFRAPDPVVCLIHGKERYLVVPNMEFNRAQRTSSPVQRGCKVQVLTSAMLGLKGARARKLSEWALALLRLHKTKRISVSAKFPHGVACRLKQAGIAVNVSKNELFPQRQIKTPQEIRMMRDAQQAGVIAMRKAMQLIADTEINKNGYIENGGEVLHCEQVQELISKCLLEQNCFCRDTIVACGPASADPHEKGSGPIRSGQPIVMDIFPQHLDHSYWGDITRTVVRGKPSAQLRKMYYAVAAAQRESLHAVRAGVQCKTVHRHGAQEMIRRGFETKMVDGKPQGFIHGTGHGVGLSIHEAPSVSNFDTRLKSGHVITIEPGLYYPEVGGVRIEDTIVVTASGWNYLVPCEKILEL